MSAYRLQPACLVICTTIGVGIIEFKIIFNVAVRTDVYEEKRHNYAFDFFFRKTKLNSSILNIIRVSRDGRQQLVGLFA